MNGGRFSGGHMNIGSGVMMYGGAPHWDPLPAIPNLLPVNPIDTERDRRAQEFLEEMQKRMGQLTPCAKCNRHIKDATVPCPFCLRADLDALKAALGKDAKPVETIATLKLALRKALGALRDVSRATGGGLEPIIAECEAALDEPKAP